MPEYHNIQMYSIINQSFRESISLCSHLFDRLGWQYPEIYKWLNNLTWGVSDDGIVYTGASGPRISVPISTKQFNVRLVLLGWTPKVIRELPTDSIELNILFETEKIDDVSRVPKIRYQEDAKNIIWHIMQEASELFSDYGVFFTDEAQANRPWQGILENDTKKLWQFESAIISSQHKLHFKLPNREYFSKQQQGQL